MNSIKKKLLEKRKILTNKIFKDLDFLYFDET
jgi:hypothetical protein